MKHARRLVAGTLAAGALALSLTGCGDSADPTERLAAKTAQPTAGTDGATPSTASQSPSPAPGGASDEAYKKWGLTAPLQYAPKPPRNRRSRRPGRARSP